MGRKVKAQFTAYYPHDSLMEGGFLDCRNQKLDPSKNTCAAPDVIGYGTKVRVLDTGTSKDGQVYTVNDRGGRIKIINGVYHIDLLMSSNAECNKFGRVNGTLEIDVKDNSSSNTYSSTKETKQSKDTSTIQKAIDYAVSKIGCRYTQDTRYRRGPSSFDCSGLVYCAYKHAGVELKHRDNGQVVSTSYLEVYAKGFQLIYPSSYPLIGKNLPSSSSVIDLIQPGDLIFTHTTSTTRANQITHVGIAISKNQFVSARGTNYGVAKQSTSEAAKIICAIIRYGSGYSGSGSSSSGGTGAEKKDPAEELEYLRKVKALSSKDSTIEHKDIGNTPYESLELDLTICHNKQIFRVSVFDGMSLSLERSGAAGKLDFSIVLKKEDTVIFREGDEVILTVNNTSLFRGFIFTTDSKKNEKLKITAYDQLRYLKNEDVYYFIKQTATQIINKIAKDYKIQLGTIADTKYVIPTLLEDNVPLFDIIQGVLDTTTLNTGTMFILYDDFGKLTLKSVEDMRVNYVISADTVQDYTYTSSIDDQTYTQVKLVYEREEESGDDEKKKTIREHYTTRNKQLQNKWGVLQLTDKVKALELIKPKAELMLEMYGKETRKLSVKGAFGDVRVRAGSLVPVILNLEDARVNNYLMVERVTHKFNNQEHTMDLTLWGGGFIV